MSSLENLMRIRRRLKEWAITFLLKIWDRRRGNASLVMLVIGLPKENLFPKSQRHTSIQRARTIFGNISNFLSQCFLYLFSVDIFLYLFPAVSFEFRLVFTFHWWKGVDLCWRVLQVWLPIHSLKLFDSENKNRFSSSDDKTLSLKLETPTTLSFVGSVGKFRLLYYSFGNAVWEHIRKYVGFVQVRIEWVSCQKTIWIVDAWQVHLAPYWARFLHQTTLHIVAFHKIIFAHFNKGVCCMGRWYASS